ncbi:ABC transporter ATP-binding protein [Paenibacillus elgii]|uniref:ABC transporter ATP-binding protein n=1 Tax=Paenibacillus elgii TaxID=189691 RepID=UPI00203DECFA|nr:ATP-binding cassette domain-containing protein [Paenibacillus elgii]MCM3267659.1 ATP-binding cassette domain-containing protein [Paenibacillus elgii]
MRLEARELGYRRGRDAWLFRGVDLMLPPGEMTGLVGPSGCGKTTLGRLLAGYEEPPEGRITVGGNPLPRTGYHPVQLVFQHPEKAVNPKWPMHRVLREGGEPDPALLEALGIEQEWLRRRPGELSGGELQRFCVARALGPHTRFLIADEMTTMLDAITQAQIWQAVRAIARQRQLGVLVVSHEPGLIRHLCTHVINWNELTGSD